MTEYDRMAFWAEMPEVRTVTLHDDGTISGHEFVSPEVFGGHIPMVGDVIGDVWGDKDYTFQTVQRRYFIREFGGDSYWVLVLKDCEPEKQFDNLSTNVLLVTDLYETIKNMDRENPSKKLSAEIQARTAQLGKSPIATKMFKPKSRYQPDKDDE